VAKGRKTGGRKPGSLNKRTFALFGEPMEVLKGLRFNPLQRMVEIANDKSAPIDLQFRATAEVAQYLYPKRSAVKVVEGATEKPAKVEYGWVPRRQSSEQSSTTPSQASKDSTSADPASKATQVQ
jgi:hypothetical protein